MTGGVDGYPSSMSNMDEAKGRVKQASGDLTDDEDLKREGELDEKGGKVKGAVGKAKDKLDDAVDSVKDRLKG